MTILIGCVGPNRPLDSILPTNTSGFGNKDYPNLNDISHTKYIVKLSHFKDPNEINRHRIRLELPINISVYVDPL